ncbi:hypothetical protein D3C72_1880370 [compost metagenome]
MIVWVGRARPHVGGRGGGLLALDAQFLRALGLSMAHLLGIGFLFFGREWTPAGRPLLFNLVFPAAKPAGWMLVVVEKIEPGLRLRIAVRREPMQFPVVDDFIWGVESRRADRGFEFLDGVHAAVC